MKINMLYTLKKDQLDDVLDIWNEKSSVYVPSGKGKDIQLLPLDEVQRTEDYINLSLPVKEMVFEQKEGLFKWTKNGECIEIEGL